MESDYGRSLTVTESRREEGYVLEAAGELDLTTGPLLSEPLMKAGAEAATSRVTVDLSLVSYIDSAGLRVLVAGHQALTKRSRPLRVVVAPGSHADPILRLCNLVTILDVVDSEGETAATGKDDAHRQESQGAERP